MQFSENGLRFTAAWETFSPVPYFATKKEQEQGLYTWGFGHTGTNPPRSITRTEAMELLRKDIAIAEKFVQRAMPIGAFNQAQYDALVDLVFNAGPRAIGANTGTGRAVRAGDIQTIRAKLPQFRMQAGVVVKGLVRRANGRLALFDGKQWDVAERIGRNSA